MGNGVKLQQAMIVLENEDLDFTIGSDLNENPKTLEGKLYVMVGEDDKAGNYTCVMYDDVDDLPTKGFLNDDNADVCIPVLKFPYVISAFYRVIHPCHPTTQSLHVAEND